MSQILLCLAVFFACADIAVSTRVYGTTRCGKEKVPTEIKITESGYNVNSILKRTSSHATSGLFDFIVKLPERSVDSPITRRIHIVFKHSCRVYEKCHRITTLPFPIDSDIYHVGDVDLYLWYQGEEWISLDEIVCEDGGNNQLNAPLEKIDEN